MDRELERLFVGVAGFFAVLAEPTRLKILNALCDGERSVSDIAARTAVSQTNVSRHLSLMYSKGLLARRRDAQMTLYSVADPAVLDVCRFACVHVAGAADGQQVDNRTLRRFMPQG